MATERKEKKKRKRQLGRKIELGSAGAGREDYGVSATKLQTVNKTPNATTTCSAQNIIGLYFKFLLVILDNAILTTTRD